MFLLISVLLILAYVVPLMVIVATAWWHYLLIALSIVPGFYVISLLQVAIELTFIHQFTSPRGKFKKFYISNMGYFITKFGFNVSIRKKGVENIPKDGNIVFFSNHKHKLDPLILYQVINRPHGYAAKSDLMKYPVIRPLIKGVGSFVVYRDDNRKTMKELLKGIKLVKGGHAMAIFPEGGTMYKAHNEITEVRDGAFKLATKAKADIIPVSIKDSNKIKVLGNWLPVKVEVTIHPPIKYEEVADLNTHEIADKVIKVINSAF